MSKRVLFPASLLAAAVAVAGAGARTAATPGVSGSTITLGGIAPLTGEASAAGNVARGADAYFKYVNSKGGVFKRKIQYKYLDDAYDPSKTVQAARQLVQQDNVLGIFGSIGTSQNLAIRKFLNDQGVPQLFVNAGATTFGKDYKKYPWTIGYIPPYAGEGEIYGRYVLKTNPVKARIAVLYQDDDYGNDLLNGLKKGLGKKQKLIVKKVGYDPTSSDVRSEVAQLKASKANTLMIFAFGKFAIQTYNYVNQLGWRPKVFVNDVAAASGVMSIEPQKVAEGSISIVFAKDPQVPLWKNDAGIKLGRTIVTKFAKGNPNDGYYYAGMASAYTMVDVLKKAGKNLTRAKVRDAAIHLTEKGNPFLLPGLVVQTTPSSRYPVAQVKLERWHAGHWIIFGKFLSAKP